MTSSHFISRRGGGFEEIRSFADKIGLTSGALRDSSRLRDSIIVKWQTDFERFFRVDANGQSLLFPIRTWTER